LENPDQEKEWRAERGDERLVVVRDRRSDPAKVVVSSLSMIRS